MDSLSVLRILLRRWWLTVPLLAIGAAGVLHYHSTLRPTFASQATILVQPPSVLVTDSGLKATNPLLLSEPKSTVIALTGVLDSPSYRNAVAGESFGSYTLLQQGSELQITGTSKDPAIALATTRHLVELFQQRLSALQKSLHVNPAQLLQAREILAPTTPLNQGTGGKQALIALAGAAVLLTVTTVVAFDAVLIRLRRRKQSRPVEPQTPSAPLTGWPEKVPTTPKPMSTSPTDLPVLGPRLQDGQLVSVGGLDR